MLNKRVTRIADYSCSGTTSALNKQAFCGRITAEGQVRVTEWSPYSHKNRKPYTDSEFDRNRLKGRYKYQVKRISNWYKGGLDVWDPSAAYSERNTVETNRMLRTEQVFVEDDEWLKLPNTKTTHREYTKGKIPRYGMIHYRKDAEFMRTYKERVYFKPGP